MTVVSPCSRLGSLAPGDRTKFSLFLRTYMKLSGYIDAQVARTTEECLVELGQISTWVPGNDLLNYLVVDAKKTVV